MKQGKVNTYQVAPRRSGVRAQISSDVVIFSPWVDEGEIEAIDNIDTIKRDDIFMGECLPDEYVTP